MIASTRLTYSMRIFMLPAAAIVLLSGCNERDSPSPLDAGGESGDLWVPPDQLPWPDLGPDAAPPPPGCEGLGGFGSAQRISARRAVQILIGTKLDRMVLLDAQGELVSISLPSGKATKLQSSILGVEWPDPAGKNLIASRISQIDLNSYDLLVVPADGSSPAKVLAQTICHHRIAPDGRSVLALAGCNSRVGLSEGTLQGIEVASGTVGWQVSGVAIDSYLFSPDGKWIAFVSDVKADPGCYHLKGTLGAVDSAGKLQPPLGPDTLASSLGFLPSGELLLQRLLSCAPDGIQLQRADPSGSTPTTALAAGMDFGPFLDRRYTVSPDGKLVLAAQNGTQQSQLFAVQTNGGGQTLLAGDLFPYQAVSLAFQPWAFSSNASHVIYTSVTSYPQIGLTAVSANGVSPLPLATEIVPVVYDVSTGADEVAFVDRSADEKRLWHALLTSGASQMRFTSKHSLEQLRFVPDRRGLLVVEQDPAKSTIHYVPRVGKGSAVALGSWGNSSIKGQTRYAVDPGGCALAYDSDQGAAGTHLVLIPR